MTKIPLYQYHKGDKTRWALSAYKSHIIEIERLIAKAADVSEKESGPNWRPETDEEFAEFFAERDAARCLYDEVMAPLERYSAVLLIYSIYEHEIIRIADEIGKKRGVMGKKSGSILKSVSEFFLNQDGLDVTQLVFWKEIGCIETIRHCIIHCYGNPTYLNDKTKFDCAITVLSPMIDLRYEDKIEIDGRACRAFLFIIAHWYMDLFKHLRWEIDEQKWDRLVADLMPNV